MSRATPASANAKRNPRVQPELLRLLAALPPAKQAEVLDFARFLNEQGRAPRTGSDQPARSVDLRLAPASSLLGLTGLVALGGDALSDTEALYDGDGSGCD
jgi:hypothetical protein